VSDGCRKCWRRMISNVNVSRGLPRIFRTLRSGGRFVKPYCLQTMRRGLIALRVRDKKSMANFTAGLTTLRRDVLTNGVCLRRDDVRPRASPSTASRRIWPVSPIVPTWRPATVVCFRTRKSTRVTRDSTMTTKGEVDRSTKRTGGYLLSYGRVRTAGVITITRWSIMSNNSRWLENFVKIKMIFWNKCVFDFYKLADLTWV